MTVASQRRIPRHDMVPLWAAGGWFYGALCCLALALTESGLLTAALLGALTVPFAGLGLWRLRRIRRDPAAAVRGELLKVLRSLRAAEGYLNRDERMAYILQVKGRLLLTRTVTVIRVPEDDVLTLQREGSASLVVHTWQVSPWEYGVTRSMQGTAVTENDLDRGVIEFPRTGFWQWQKSHRAAKKAGMLFAPDDEIRTLIGALRDSEPMSPDGEP